MMMARKHGKHWRAGIGALAVAGLAFGLSIRLEGAAHVPAGLAGKGDLQKTTISVDDAQRSLQIERSEQRALVGAPVVYGNKADLMHGDIPTFPVVVVDYRDDDATRMREAGLLEGPLPMPSEMGGVASGTLCLANCTAANVPFSCCTGNGTGTCTCCSFEVDCDDANPCTVDSCNFTPGQSVGSGTCEHSTAANGTDGSPGNAQCPDNFGSACEGCNDGLFCNGVETCQGGVCVPGTPPCSGLQVCSETFNMCQDLACTSAADCHDASKVGAAFKAEADKTCNGTEICNGGVCVAGENPCGSGALCSEKQCSQGPQIDFCITDEDCAVVGGTCSLLGPVCKPGRCCRTSAPGTPGEPACERRLKDGTCAGGTRQGASCTPATQAVDCPGSTCPTAGTSGYNQSCDGVGGVFYGGDDGTISSGGGIACPVINGVLIKCPKYGSGVAPRGAFPMLLGPVSDSPATVAPFAGPLHKLGDDYKLSNPGICVGGTRAGLGCGATGDCPSGTCNLSGPSFIALDYLRFIGGSPVTDRISFEFYDKDGNFVEDLFFVDNNAFGLHPVLFSPPIVIPAEGYVVMRVAPGFSPNARHVWASTDAVDVGTNDSNKLWINGGPVTGGVVNSTTGILAFELEGSKVAGNFGACCYDGTCTSGTRTGKGCHADANCPGGGAGSCNGSLNACNNGVTNFECRGFGGSYLGNASLCAACSAGGNAGQYCRSCSNNLATVCNSDADCPGGTCINDNGDCPGGGVCTSEPACNEGGCCTFGVCTVASEAVCTAVHACTSNACVGGARNGLVCTGTADCTGNYLGNGTDCDADNGYDDGQQQCCPQPLSSYSGADNCEDVVLHVITAPPIGETKVITITGNNSGATDTFANPDSCFDPSNDPNADPGWWEGFTLTDACTIMYVDHCCTDPIHRPAYRTLYDSCPCGSPKFTTPNPYNFPEPADSRGLPYCAEDDNAWQCFGLLTPGTYYYPIYSALAGHHGQYQLHFVAKACPTAACCTTDQCVDNVTQLQCDALGGLFQAPPHRAQAVTTCSGTNGQPGSTCYDGSCCTGPGECFDQDGVGGRVQKSECTAQQGQFKGGIFCHGGSCAAAPLVSCSVDTDCGANGPCSADNGGHGNAAQQAQLSPCPICEIAGPGNCQTFETASLNIALADRHLGQNGILSADDVKPDGNTLTSVCIWGFYLNGDPNAAAADCAPSVAADHFQIRLFNNSLATGRTPGTLVTPVGSTTGTSQKGIEAGSRVKTLIGSEVYGFHIVLDTPISGLTPGNVYWLEVSNDVSDSPIPTCEFWWMQKSPDSGSYSFGGTNAGYQNTFETPFDLSFCTNFSFSASTVGTTGGACCTCDGVCSVKTLNDCANANGVWDVTKTTCSGVTCPAGAPSNDSCNTPTTITPSSFTVNNQCATTDGFGPIPDDVGDSQLDFDLWYKFVAPSGCDLVVSECPTGTRFDSMLAVYHNPNNPSVCPPCPFDASSSAFALAGVGQDESCTGALVGGPGIWKASEQLGRNALPGECFLLRIGSFPGNRGTANIDVTCPTGGATPGPVVVQTNSACTAAGAPFACCTSAGAGSCDKVRFISFTPPSNSVGETAIRVKLVDMHHVLPPYTGQPTVAYSAFNGQSVYVGPPVNFVESNSSQTPFKSSQTQCTPYYQDWNTVGLLHVRGSAIAPSSSFSVEHLASACNGVEGSALCSTAGSGNVSAAAAARTTRWGDVETPYVPPNPNGQPDFTDIGSMVNKFTGALGASIKARVEIQSVNTFGDISNSALGVDFGFGHISACVDAFQGRAYPAKMGRCAIQHCALAPNGVCTTNADCTGAGNSCAGVACTVNSDCGANGPCNLNCVASPP